MANPQRGTVEVELDGKPHQLRYTLNALAEIENRLGLQSIDEVLTALKGLSMRSLRTLLWAGLLDQRPELSEQDVGRMDFEFVPVVRAVSEGISSVFDAPPGGPEGNGRAASRRRGGPGAARSRSH